MAAPARSGPMACLACGVLIAGCTLLASPMPSLIPSPVLSPTSAPSGSPLASSAASPLATPEPGLSLDLPAERDERPLRVVVTPEVAADAGGRITVSVTNLATERIDEIVLRWPAELGERLFLAPFEPSEDRIRDGGPPLVQAWTKWVLGPGERGEAAGTISLGYGPMDPGMQLDIPLYVTRLAPGPLAFDLQLLAGEALLKLEEGGPAELRVEIP